MALSLESGGTIAGKYRLDRLIGRGGMGEVWSAEQTITKKRVAMKFLNAEEAAKGGETRRRFMREARAACSVQHPNVVQIHDVIEAEDSTPVLVMELLKGESLEQKLQREGKLGVEETIGVLMRVVSAVGTAHTQGVVHRDLKPDNIFLSETPDGVEVKVLDFGIAKVGPSEDGGQTGALTTTGTMLGTPYYMSPEQAFGEKKIDHRADIWSLGIVMFRCLSGQLPTKADNLGQILKIIMTKSIPKLAEVAPNAPPDLAKLVDKMLSYAASDRPADLREVKVALEAILSGGVAEVPPDFGPPAIDANSISGVAVIPEARSVALEAAAPKRSSSGVIALVGAVVLVAATGGFLFWKRSKPAPAAPAETAAATAAPEPTLTTTAVIPTPTTSPSIADATTTVTTTASASASIAVQGGATTASARPATTPQAGARPTTPTSKPATGAPSAPQGPGMGAIVEKPGF